MCLFIISLLYGRHYFGCGCACGLANDFLDDAAAATFCVFCVWRFGASFLWQFDAILLSHRSVGHFRVVSGSHKFRHVGHFVACWDINSMPMSNVVASYNFALLRLPIVVACLLLLLPLVVVVAYVVTWASSYRGFAFPFRYENIIYLHSFLLLKKLHCFPKLIGNLHTHTHTHRHTHSRRTAVHVFSISCSSNNNNKA